MKKYISKIAAIGVCAAFAAAAGISAYALNDKTENETESKPVQTEEKAAPEETTKDETVYVLAGADGSVNKIIVSDWLKNAAGSSSVKDFTEISNAENIKGNEAYSADGSGIVWDASGKDIYYSGNIDKELPVKMSVTYTLDGKAVYPSELAGKSGRLVIRYDFENNQYETVNVDGKDEKIYVPFAMLTGMLLDNDVCRNIEVSNGKIVNDGDRTIVAGIAFPGLQSNLDIDSEKLEIPDYVKISMDVTDFEMTNTVTVATNSVFNNINTDDIDSFDSLDDSLGELNDGMNSLLDGSSQLYDGLDTLLEKSGELVAGIDSLADGASQLKTGASDLNGGAAQLADGAAQLKEGLDKLSENSAALESGSEQVFESLLSMADSKLSEAGLDIPKLTPQNYSEVLDGVLANLDGKAYNTALEKVTAAVNAKKSDVEKAVTEAVKQEVTTKVLSAMDMTVKDYEAGVKSGAVTAEQQAKVEAAVAAQMETDEVKALISQKTEEQIKTLIEQNMDSDDVKNQIAAGEKQAAAGAESIKELKAQLDSYSEFYAGLAAYTEGVDSAKTGAENLSGGAEQLKSGVQTLDGGMSELYGGISAMKDASPELLNGITQLRDGSCELSDGLKEFNERGIQKLIEAVDGDLDGLMDRINASKEVSENYSTFAGISDDMDGEVKFIYRTEAISAE